MQKIIAGFIGCLAWTAAVFAQPTTDQTAFEEADMTAGWREVFFDSCTDDWTDKWFLDGEIAAVLTGPDGMTLTAGPQPKNDAHSMVLWTKQSFSGNVKIEYEYIRRDFATQYANILYIQATGSEVGSYTADITEWNALRRIPSMSLYFNHMNTYHLSYASYGAEPGDTEPYVRARRYMPEKKGLKGTELPPDYFPEKLFEPGVLHQIMVIKIDRQIYVRISNSEQTMFFHMDGSKFPPVTEGRIGLRQMFTRSALYKNFRISSQE